MKRREFVLGAAGVAASMGALGPARARAEGLKIKKALVLGMLPKEAPLEERFQLAREVGFDGVEVYTMPDADEVERTRAAAEKSGLVVHSIMNSDHWRYPLSSADPEVVDRSIQGVETSIRNAAALGAETVLIVPAVVNSETRYEDAFGRSRRAIERLLPMAEREKVILAVENVWNRFLLSPIEFAKYVDEFGSPYLQAYFDVGNIEQYGVPAHWILSLGERIKKLHVKGYDGRKRDFKNLGEGSIDWPAVQAALAEIGFEGYMTAEIGGGDRDYLADVSRRMDRIIAGEKPYEA